jgi:hypothetical protein
MTCNYRKETRSLCVKLPPDVWDTWHEYCQLVGLPKKNIMIAYIQGLKPEIERLKREQVGVECDRL